MVEARSYVREIIKNCTYALYTSWPKVSAVHKRQSFFRLLKGLDRLRALRARGRRQGCCQARETPRAASGVPSSESAAAAGGGRKDALRRVTSTPVLQNGPLW